MWETCTNPLATPVNKPKLFRSDGFKVCCRENFHLSISQNSKIRHELNNYKNEQNEQFTHDTVRIIYIEAN